MSGHLRVGRDHCPQGLDNPDQEFLVFMVKAVQLQVVLLEPPELFASFS
ncbi:MAG: hypothetical protein ACLFUE_06170 [Desulfobacteraceae bacterium]